MIKVNLCPIDELESSMWYIPDVALLLAVLLTGYFGVDYYFDTLRDEIAERTASANDARTGYSQLAPDIERFKNLQSDIDELKTKLSALQDITVSKIAKFRPLIALEHLQNIRPEGLWYETIDINADSTYSITGKAFDNILVAELMTSLNATQSQEVEASDLRTQVYFQRTELQQTIANKGEDDFFVGEVFFPRFEIQGAVGERVVFAENNTIEVSSIKGADRKGRIDVFR